MQTSTRLGLAIATVAGTGICLAQNLSVQRYNGGWNEWWNGATDSWQTTPATIPANLIESIDVGTIGNDDVFIRVVDDTTGRTAVVEGLTFVGTSASGNGVLHIMVGVTFDNVFTFDDESGAWH